MASRILRLRKREDCEPEKKETVRKEENQGTVASWKPPGEDRASR